MDGWDGSLGEIVDVCAIISGCNIKDKNENNNVQDRLLLKTKVVDIFIIYIHCKVSKEM